MKITCNFIYTENPKAISMIESILIQSMQYRYDTIKEYTTTLKSLSEQYQTKIKKYRRRITAIDVTVYSIYCVLASAGIILSSVTMIAPVAVPIAISAIATLAGMTTAITKQYLVCNRNFIVITTDIISPLMLNRGYHR